MRSAPPIAPGMPRKKASPAIATSCAARATLTSGTPAPARMRSPVLEVGPPVPGEKALACPAHDIAEAAAKPHHHAWHAAVPHDQVRAETDDGDGDVRGAVPERRGG